MAGLLDALKAYIADAAPGGLLNQEQPKMLSDLLNYGKTKANYIGGLLDPQSPINNDFQNWHKRTQLGLADQLAGKQTPAAEQAYQTMMGMAGMAPVGMIAYHGSPHKFDKFSLDKIGTGEGAQAYGHGLYLAEAPAVAQEYAGALSAAKATKPVGNVDLTQAYQNLPNDVPETLLAARRDFRALTDAGELSTADRRDFLTAVKNNLAASKNGQLYKTDIPDEAVARFLDWDKPLSQQAPEVRQAIESHQAYPAIKSWLDRALSNAPPNTEATGQAINEVLAGKLGGQAAVSDLLRKQGIPGIRYLDGGPRSAGQGSSNFVAFDPEMIRILERNGQPTGQQPWGLGEWMKANSRR